MKKLIIVSTIAAFAVTVVSAQGIEKSFRLGLNLSNVVGSDIDGNIKPGINAGFLLDVNFTDNFFLQPGLVYSLKGTKDRAKGSISYDGMSIKATEKGVINLHYIEVPVSAGYRFGIGNNLSLQFHTGPYLAFGVAGKVKFTEEVRVDGEKVKVSESENVFGNGNRRFDMGWNFGGGVRMSRIFAGLQYGVGMVNFHEGLKERNGNFSINLGYYF